MQYQLLKKLGMNENEIKIYLFLLKTGESTAPEISKNTNIDKATIYRALDNLITLGFVSEIKINKIKRFTASPPHKLIDKTEELKEELKKIIPELQKLSSLQRTTAQVELYQGKEGIKTVLRDILESKQPYIMMGHAQTFFEEIPVYCDIWLSRIVKKKVKGKILYPKDEFVKIAKNEEFIYMPKELTSLISTWIYGDKTAQFIMTTPAYVVLIKNKEVAESNKKIFDYLWKKAKKQ